MNYKFRKFLNEIESKSAMIKTNIKMGTHCKNNSDCENCNNMESHYSSKEDCFKNTSINIDSNIEIMDCSDKIYLDFHVYKSNNSELYIKNNLNKIGVLIDALNEFKINYELAVDEFRKNDLKYINMKKALLG